MLFLKRKQQFDALPLSCDFIVSLGEACRPAGQLANAGLRVCSNPLDWMLNYSLDVTILLFQNKFKDFFTDIEDLGVHEERWGPHHRIIQDNKSKMRDIHHFSIEEALEVTLRRFSEVMQHRYERMNECLAASDSIVLICNRSDQPERFAEFLTLFHQIYDKPCTMINVRHSPNDEEYSCYEQLDSGLSIIEHGFADVPSSPEQVVWLGNTFMWQKILKQITVSDKLKSVIEKYQHSEVSSFQ